MKTLTWSESWELKDKVKRRLFNHLRNKVHELQNEVLNLTFGEYRKRLEEEIHSSILDEWNEIKEEYEDYKDHRGIRLTVTLKGFLYEVLFYYACLGTQSFFMDAEFAEMGGAEFPESPPWFEANPLYDINPILYKVRGERKAPQTDADFLITYVSDEGPTAPALVDVKSRKLYPSDKNMKRWSWQIMGAMRRGFIFQLAYPRDGVKYPKDLNEWEFRTPCTNCGNLSEDFKKCDDCGKVIIPFTITDARYEAERLWEMLGKIRKGRF